jgi:hypothetical protein
MKFCILLFLIVFAPFSNSHASFCKYLLSQASQKTLRTAILLEPKTDKSTQIILEEAVNSSRLALLRAKQDAKKRRFDQIEPSYPLSPRDLWGWCGYMQAAIYFRLMELSINAKDIHDHQAALLFGDARHAFNVVKMPNGKIYLVDTTFGQFLSLRFNSEVSKIFNNPKFKKISDELMDKGYMELNEDVIEAFGTAV